MIAVLPQASNPDIRLATGLEDLIGLSRTDLIERLAGIGLPKFRAGQIWHWLYHRGTTDLDEMTTLASRLGPVDAVVPLVGGWRGGGGAGGGHRRGEELGHCAMVISEPA